jgi:hypothetical protein
MRVETLAETEAAFATTVPAEDFFHRGDSLRAGPSDLERVSPACSLAVCTI